MKKQYEFHFRHILKDGTILKEGEKLPVTPAIQAAFAEVARILIEARKKILVPATTVAIMETVKQMKRGAGYNVKQ